MSLLTATMSARCTITSAMRRSCSDRMLRSMVRSITEKPTSSGVVASSTTFRSSRTEPAFQPNKVRIARNSQLSAAGRSSSPSCTTAGRLSGLRALAVLSGLGSESGIFSSPVPASRIGVGNAELGEDLAFQRLHRLGVVVILVVVADQMKEAMHREMTQMMVKGLVFLVGFPPGRLIGDRDVAEHARHVIGRIAGWLQRGKRQHVGRLVDAAPVAVERPDAGIVRQHDGELGIVS